MGTRVSAIVSKSGWLKETSQGGGGICFRSKNLMKQAKESLAKKKTSSTLTSNFKSRSYRVCTLMLACLLLLLIHETIFSFLFYLQ